MCENKIDSIILTEDVHQRLKLLAEEINQSMREIDELFNILEKEISDENK
jgi:hypothetical protein